MMRSRLAVRSGIIVAPGANERFILEAGFTDLQVRGHNREAARTRRKVLEARWKFKDSARP